MVGIAFGGACSRGPTDARKERGSAANSASTVAPPQPSPQPPVEAAAPDPSPQPPVEAAAPDLTTVLGRSASQVATVLGPTVATDIAPDPDERNYRVGAMRFLVTYRDDLALDVIVGAEGMTPSAIKQRLGLSGAAINANGRRFAITEGSQTLSISDTTLPKHRIDIKRILGKRAAGVRQILGKPENELLGSDVFHPWAPDDRIGVIVNYDDTSRATWVEVAFDDGPLPPGGDGPSSYAAQLAWLGLPVATEITVEGERYSLSVSGGAIELKKH